MGKTNFSGPVRVGTNENNMGYLVNAVTLSAGPSVPSSSFNGDTFYKSWSSWTGDGEDEDTGPWTKIPPSSQIVDVQVISEIGFNASNYVTTATISAANHTVNCALTSGSVDIIPSSDTYDGSSIRKLQGCPVSADSGVFSDLTKTSLTTPPTGKVRLNKPSLITHAAKAVTFHTNQVVKVVWDQTRTEGNPQIGDSCAASGYSGDYPLPATNATRRIAGRTAGYASSVGQILFLVMNGVCQASSTAFTLTFPSGGTIALGEEGVSAPQREKFLNSVPPPEINGVGGTQDLNLSLGFNNVSGSSWQTGVVPPRGNARVNKWGRDLHNGQTTSPLVKVKYECTPENNFPTVGAFRAVIFYVDNGGVD